MRHVSAWCIFELGGEIACEREFLCLTPLDLTLLLQGLRVKMITGDQALIGRETAKQLGMGTNIFNTEVLLKVQLGTQRGCSLTSTLCASNLLHSVASFSSAHDCTEVLI